MDVATHAGEHGGPHLEFTTRNIVLFAFFVAVAIAALYFLLPRLAGLEDTWNRIEDGNPLWLGLALVFTVVSFLGYVLLFQSVYVGPGMRLTLNESYQVTMAGLAATRLLAAGGAGGIVLTAWAMRRAGMPPRTVADRTVAFLVVMYFIYLLALVICGFGLRLGVLPGNAPFAFTAVPAALSLIALVIISAMALVPTDFERRLQGWAARGGRLEHLAQRLATVPATMSAGVRTAIRYLRTGDPAVLGSVVYWGFQVAVLWASFRAFGDAPPVAVLVVAFFVGMLGNLLPLPGGVGGVDGGMIGSLIAFGVGGGLAVVAVLVFRGFTFWLPTIPGAIAYLQLRRTVERWKDSSRAPVQPARAAGV